MEFRDAFSCFHYSTSEPKGSDCIDNFRKMQECMMAYPVLYPMDDKSEPVDEPDTAQAPPTGGEKDQFEEPSKKESVS